MKQFNTYISIDGVFRTRTLGDRMEGADKSTELRRPPSFQSWLVYSPKAVHARKGLHINLHTHTLDVLKYFSPLTIIVLFFSSLFFFVPFSFLTFSPNHYNIFFPQSTSLSLSPSPSLSLTNLLCPNSRYQFHHFTFATRLSLVHRQCGDQSWQNFAILANI